MPFFGILFFLIFVVALSLLTITSIWRYIATKELVHLKNLAVAWALPSILIALALHAHYPITKDRVVGVYEIDEGFYPGANANWQKEHFHFEITKDNQFLFHEKLKDGSYKTARGKIEWLRRSPPMLYRTVMDNDHPLIDEYPTLYRGNRKFYYVFQSKFGTCFTGRSGS